MLLIEILRSAFDNLFAILLPKSLLRPKQLLVSFALVLNRLITKLLPNIAPYVRHVKKFLNALTFILLSVEVVVVRI